MAEFTNRGEKTAAGPTPLDELAARVERLEPADRFRLVAALLEAGGGREHLAETIARRTVDELAAVRLFARRSPAAPATPGRWK